MFDMPEIMYDGTLIYMYSHTNFLYPLLPPSLPLPNESRNRRSTLLPKPIAGIHSRLQDLGLLVVDHHEIPEGLNTELEKGGDPRSKCPHQRKTRIEFGL
jgi:hypothetical protein